MKGDSVERLTQAEHLDPMRPRSVWPPSSLNNTRIDS